VPVGSLVAPSPAFRSAMGTGEGAALLLALRRGTGHLYYPGADREFWVPMRDVRPIPADVVPETSLERLLSDLLLSLDADECHIEEVGPNALTLLLEVPALRGEQMDALREVLGPRLRSHAVEPRSMRALHVRIELVSLPAHAGAGT